MMDGNIQMDFNYRIFCLKTRKLKSKSLHIITARYHSISLGHLLRVYCAHRYTLRSSNRKYLSTCYAKPPHVGHIGHRYIFDQNYFR